MAAQRLLGLRSGDEFDSVYREGSAFSGPFFVIRLRRNELGANRYGFAVGKRLVRLATRRNTLKRRLRELVRRLELPQGFDVIVSVKQQAVPATFAELSAALKLEASRAFQRFERQ